MTQEGARLSVQKATTKQNVERLDEKGLAFSSNAKNISARGREQSLLLMLHVLLRFLLRS